MKKLVFLFNISLLFFAYCQEKNYNELKEISDIKDIIIFDEVSSDTLAKYNSIEYKIIIKLYPYENHYIVASSYDENGKFFMKYMENNIEIRIDKDKRKWFQRKINKSNFYGAVDENVLKQMIIQNCNYVLINKNGIKLTVDFCVPDTDACESAAFIVKYNKEIIF